MGDFVVISLLLQIPFNTDEPDHMTEMPSLHQRLKQTIMPETIPLRTTLSIKSQNIIIDYTIGTTFLLDLVYVRISAVAGVARLVERPVERDADAGDDFFRRGRDDGRRQEIQHS